MNAEPVHDEVPEDQIGQRLAELTATVRAGEEAGRARAKLIVVARFKYKWTQQKIADACQMSQVAVSLTLKPYLTKSPPR